MKPAAVFCAISMLTIIYARAQNPDSAATEPKYRVWLHFTNGEVEKGLLINTTDTTITVFPGTRKQWRNRDPIGRIKEGYANINTIRIYKKGRFAKSLLIGTGIGLAPLLATIFKSTIGEGAVYVTLVTVPLGIITGTIVGLSRKNYRIDGDRNQFYRFHKNVFKN